MSSILLKLESPCLRLQRCPLVLTPETIFTAAPAQRSRDYNRPCKQMATILRDTGSKLRIDRDNFQVNLDVKHFAPRPYIPRDILVKTVDGFLVIEGRHEEKQDKHGYVSRKFTRRYALPEGCNVDTVKSQLSSDGLLTVTAPLASPVRNERIVPIVQTGPVRTHEGLEGEVDEFDDGQSAEDEPVETGQ